MQRPPSTRTRTASVRIDGAGLLQLRRCARQSQVEVARRAGISATYLSLIEKGQRTISPAVFVQLCNALEVTATQDRRALLDLAGSIQIDGPQLRKERQLAGYSQTELADRAGISFSFVSLIEKGLRRVTPPVFICLYRALDLTSEQAWRDLPAEVRDLPAEVVTV